jgi:HEAT repeat protein
VLGNVGTLVDATRLEAALQHDEPLVREHAAWALLRIGAGTAVDSRCPSAEATPVRSTLLE